MDLIQAIILGVVQGLTEFLPVSSSGHLVICQYLFGIRTPQLVFDIGVHLGTLMAVVVFFRQDLLAIIRAILGGIHAAVVDRRPIKEIFQAPHVRLAVLIVMGSIPTALIGIGLSSIAERLFSSVVVVGLMLMGLGLVLWLTRRIETVPRKTQRLSVAKALVIGLVQGVAIVPGISRSGTTIAAGLFLGLDRKVAARFSFLLSIPAIVGASVLTLGDLSAGSDFAVGPIVAGALTAAVVGYGALRLLVYMVTQGRLYVFAPYCVIIGMVALLTGL